MARQFAKLLWDVSSSKGSIPLLSSIMKFSIFYTYLDLSECGDKRATFEQACLQHEIEKYTVDVMREGLLVPVNARIAEIIPPHRILKITVMQILE